LPVILTGEEPDTNPIMLHAVVTYANMREVRAVDRIVDLCQRGMPSMTSNGKAERRGIG